MAGLPPRVRAPQFDVWVMDGPADHVADVAGHPVVRAVLDRGHQNNRTR